MAHPRQCWHWRGFRVRTCAGLETKVVGQDVQLGTRRIYSRAVDGNGPGIGARRECGGCVAGTINGGNVAVLVGDIHLAGDWRR